MKKIVILLLFLLTFTAFSSTIFAETHNVILTNGNQVEVFISPQKDSEIYSVNLESNQTYHFNQKNGEYYAINFAGIEGYIHSKDIEKTLHMKRQSFNSVKVNDLTIKAETNIKLKESKESVARTLKDFPISTFISEDTDYYYIEIGGHLSRIEKIDTVNSQLDKEQVNKDLKQFSVNSNEAYIFAKPDLKQPIIKLYPNVVYQYEEKNEDQLEVAISGKKAYIDLADISLVGNGENPPADEKNDSIKTISIQSTKDIFVKDEKSGENIALLLSGNSFKVTKLDQKYFVDISGKAGVISSGEFSINDNKQDIETSEPQVKPEIDYSTQLTIPRVLSVPKVFTNYFKSAEDKVSVYDNRSGSLVEVGFLEKNQVYPITRQYTSWHQIKFDNYYGYVRKSSTLPADGSVLKNETSTTARIREFTAQKDLEVYDNTSGKLVQYGTIKKGLKYGILRDYTNWWEVAYAGRRGYVRKSDVITNFKNTDKYFRTLSEDVPIYDNRSGSLVKVGTLEKGEIYPIVKHHTSWHQIKFDNYYGYVRKSSTVPADGTSLKNETNTTNRIKEFTANKDLEVYDNTSGRLVQYGTINSGLKYGIVKDYTNWWEVTLAGRRGYVRKSDVSTGFTKYDRYFKTRVATPIYDNRSGSLVKVGELPANEEYMRVAHHTSWHQIKFSNYYGYVRLRDTYPLTSVSSSKLSTKSPINQTVNSDKDVLVYSSNSKSSGVIGKIMAGTQYKVVSQSNNGWLEVNFSNRIGYISLDSIYPMATYSKTLSEAIEIQLKSKPQTDKYRNQPAYIHSSYVTNTSGHYITGDGVALRTEPYTTQGNATVYARVNTGTKVKYIRSVKGTSVGSSTTWYEVEYNNKKLFVHSSLVEESTGLRTLKNAKVQADTKSGSHTYVVYAENKSISSIRSVAGESLNGNNTWYEIRLGSWRLPTRSDLEAYINPDKQSQLQFLNLSTLSGATSTELNKVLSGKGILNGRGNAYTLAGSKYGVNEAYLVSHSLLETGNGGSSLANGIVMGIDKNNNVVQQTDSNKGTLKNVKKVYNMYGIGAYDNCAITCGARYAYNKGWTDVDKAIIEGAAFVSNGYFDNKQETLYEMRWNPAAPGTHQYATDIGWAQKQTYNIQRIYDEIKNPVKIYKMGQYKK